jgi:magnesium transporter
MLTTYDSTDGALVKREDISSVSPATIWLDLLNPTKEEDRFVEAALAITVPTREEMAEIEASSRLYLEGGAYYMTAVLMHQQDWLIDPPTPTPITFILAGHRLVTVRYAEPRAFQIFLNRAQKKDAPCVSGITVLVALLEAIIDREADRVERIQGEVDKLSQTVFGSKGGQRTRAGRFDVNIRTIGREGELTSRSRETLLTLDRLLTYLAHVMSERGDDKPASRRQGEMSCPWPITLDTYRPRSRSCSMPLSA